MVWPGVSVHLHQFLYVCCAEPFYWRHLGCLLRHQGKDTLNSAAKNACMAAGTHIVHLFKLCGCGTSLSVLHVLVKIYVICVTCVIMLLHHHSIVVNPSTLYNLSTLLTI